MKLKNLIALFAFVCTFTIVGCSSDDKSVAENVTKSLNDDPATTGLTVSVTDGVATISGEVLNEEAKAKAGRIAEGVKGVKSINNNVTVDAPVMEQMPPTTDTPVVSIPDTTLAP